MPHLEPSSSGNNLVISAKYQDYNLYDETFGYPHYVDKFTIQENIIGYVVDGTNWNCDETGGYFDLHIAYEKNNQIIYRLERIELSLSYGGIYRKVIDNNNNYEFIVSANYGESSRTAPDISLKNGKPVVTYRGVKSSQQWVKFEGGGDQVLNITSYPVYVRYKTGEYTWGTIHIYNSNSNEFQTKPDVEGSRDAEGYIISFLRGSMFRKFVKLDNQTGYYCNPETFEGTDSKIAKGSYIGLYGQNSNPAILTLSYPQSSLYTIGTQNFIITNNSNPAQDGFSNLSGIIDRENTDYIMTLGPILVSNTITGFDDTGDSLTIQSIYEFNESMTSKAFALSNNDTLILKGYGFHITSPGIQPDPLIYKVDLKYKSNDQLLRELFKDTVQNNDTIDIDYLRGFIITGIQSGTDSFYVQMSVDTATGGDGDYAMGGEYESESGEGGDNLHGYRTLVIFENSVNNPTGKIIPFSYNLEQNYPNPFNPVTKIQYEIPKDGLVNLKVYDILGREVKNLVNEVKSAGRYSVLLDGSDLSSGVYFYRIESGDFVQVKRMILLK